MSLSLKITLELLTISTSFSTLHYRYLVRFEQLADSADATSGTCVTPDTFVTVYPVIFSG